MEEPDVTLLLIRGTACDVVGIDSETVLRNMVSESRIVTSEKGCEGPSELPRVTAWYHVPALCTVCQEVTEAEAASGHIKTNGESFHDKTPGALMGLVRASSRFRLRKSWDDDQKIDLVGGKVAHTVIA